MSLNTSMVARLAGISTAPQADSSTLTQRQWADFRRYNSPVIDRLKEASNDTSIVDAAVKRAGNIESINRNQINRVTGRRVSSMSPAQQRAVKDRLAAGAAGDGASSIYSARLAQRDVNNAAVDSAMDIAATMDGQALSALSNSDAMKMSRDAQNAANARAARGGFLSTLGTVAGGAIGFMYGGPQGAALGASLGGSAGSMFG